MDFSDSSVVWTDCEEVLSSVASETSEDVRDSCCARDCVRLASVACVLGSAEAVVVGCAGDEVDAAAEPVAIFAVADSGMRRSGCVGEIDDVLLCSLFRRVDAPSWCGVSDAAVTAWASAAAPTVTAEPETGAKGFSTVGAALSVSAVSVSRSPGAHGSAFLGISDGGDESSLGTLLSSSSSSPSPPSPAVAMIFPPVSDLSSSAKPLMYVVVVSALASASSKHCLIALICWRFCARSVWIVCLRVWSLVVVESDRSRWRSTVRPCSTF